jgi:hypothetical protein
MSGLWTSLVLLIVGSAIVPIQIVVTILLLRRSRLTALAWVAGMSNVRVFQGVLFGLVLGSIGAATADTGDGGSGLVVSTLLLVVAVLFLVTAVRQFIGEEDPDAPPPQWMATVDGINPLKAFLIAAGLLGQVLDLHTQRSGCDWRCRPRSTGGDDLVRVVRRARRIDSPCSHRHFVRNAIQVPSGPGLDVAMAQ